MNFLAVTPSDGSLLDLLWQMKGPEFLFAYAFWFLALYLPVLGGRVAHGPNPLFTALGILLFEGLGMARFEIGKAHGMKNWTLLFIMMGVGLVLFLMQGSTSAGQGDGSSTGSGCSGGGGCGGGGCGGGCGGCGG